MKINPNGFREYDARWIFEKDIDIEGITNLGKGLGTQIIQNTEKNNPRVIVGHDYRSYSEKIKKALSDGLITTVLPAAIAGANFQINVPIGEFQGRISATTPNGSHFK